MGFFRGASLPRLAMLPYNPASGAKYEWLGRPYSLTAPSPSPAHIDLLATAQAGGLQARIE